MVNLVSGEICQEPVVTKTGHVYEKSLIIKYLLKHSRDPLSNEEINADDLIPIQQQKVQPRAPQSTSVPNLLLMLQNEYDSVMLETFQLRQKYETTRLELATALYEADAAKRVIARLINERDEARNQLLNFQVSSKPTTATQKSAKPSEEEEMDVDKVAQLPAAVISKIDETDSRYFVFI